jgi:hypothetical protein
MTIGSFLKDFSDDTGIGFIFGIVLAAGYKKYGTKFLDLLVRNINLPFNLIFFTNKKFYGLDTKYLEQTGFSIVQVSSLLYEIYCIFKQYNLTNEDSTKILYLDSFKDKGTINTIGLFNRIENRGIQSVEKFFEIHDNTTSHERFKSLIKEFELICNPYIEVQQSYLLMMLSGSCFGATYSKELYGTCVRIACNMTISNPNLINESNLEKSNRLILLVSYFLPTSRLSEDFIELSIDYLRLNYKEKDFDIYSFIMLTINSQLH